jgi:hypothetical protein
MFDFLCWCTENVPGAVKYRAGAGFICHIAHMSGAATATAAALIGPEGFCEPCL